ncbi:MULTISPECIES: polysaccharide biosynthesis protein [Streptococcus]|jgi:cps9E, putative|uniref:UDP-N-acetyl-alpha-D-glucosamine C6 dehydratase n=1 Tax=Streptococcus sanguinis TaxID=1305 RepID=A0A428AAL9_STRSA|nr:MULTISPECIES: nucleoside-diphosphate sugar epimerase/dehydratase [Streptococcus]MBF1697754.1 polysaccharide biosynthesis protein [Streptococcus cristatus]MBZ2062409.1 polysaccharide biosynthesis protein [Streptococcus sanguinis]MBZ2064620.1 polysaccharide biosynthesis protein [Streptococcus sanguinis]RSI24402.1 UDP-N-acetyl-alpha-D-glucosamine C6 dehydratase [Streptococcus sanguinis]RSI32619.1 UDP-N-acetyl-alpha-D-glucosamine C6 dehydratase [Streptococcus sanguinis]
MTRARKRVILIIVDIILLSISQGISKFFLAKYVGITDLSFVSILMGIIILYLTFATLSNVFSTITRYTDYKTMFRVGGSILGAYSIVYIAEKIFYESTNSRYIVLSMLLSFLLVIASRLTWREIHEFVQHPSALLGKKVDGTKTLVVGSGDGASLFIKTAQQKSKDLKIVAIVDDDKNKQNTYLHGVKVVGTTEQIPEIVGNYEVEQIVIAIPSLAPDDYERIVEYCQQTEVKVNAMPKYEQVITGKLSVSKLQEIDIADLLGRKEVKLDQQSLKSNIKCKTVLVTGAGGSIGSELCRQIAQFCPARLLLLGHGENSIYLIHKELSSRYKDDIELIPIIADIQDRERIFHIMETYRPDRVYHAAAHKHVPLMEYNPTEAVKNNIYGTRNVAEAAKAAGVAKFVMISTDKAVNPPNVMGATKRVAEMVVTSLNEEGKTLFSAVRFGNVLGSRGSVVPLFKEQIAKGGPITVTDFRMTRYFMTIPEASRLVIQAGALMQGGEVFVLDMGEPVKILDLAKKMITLSGHTEEEIQIQEAGIRPGEKLYEELLSAKEKVNDQVYEKIFVGNVQSLPKIEVDSYVDSLLSLGANDLKDSLVKFAQQ